MKLKGNHSLDPEHVKLPLHWFRTVSGLTMEKCLKSLLHGFPVCLVLSKEIAFPRTCFLPRKLAFLQQVEASKIKTENGGFCFDLFRFYFQFRIHLCFVTTHGTGCRQFCETSQLAKKLPAASSLLFLKQREQETSAPYSPCFMQPLLLIVSDDIQIWNPTIRPIKDLLIMVKRRKLQWYGHVSSSSGLAKTILQGTVKGGRRWGRQRKRWEDNIREQTGLEFGKSQRAVENREKWRKLVVKSSVVPQRPSRFRDRWEMR